VNCANKLDKSFYLVYALFLTFFKNQCMEEVYEDNPSRSGSSG